MAQDKNPAQTPEGGRDVEGYGPQSAGGNREAYDPTVEPGQYPPGIAYEVEMFGMKLPTGTGAGGTKGAFPGPSDSTNEPGQLNEGISGLGPADTANTGAPGTATPDPTPGGDNSVTFTEAGSYLTGTYKSTTVQDFLSGPRDSTQANDEGYATGGAQLPGLKGNEPEAGSGRFQPPPPQQGGVVLRDSPGGGPGSGGRVLRGGRAVNPR